MCIFPKNNTASVNQDVGAPQQTATPTAIGSSRKTEDQSLFGGTPDLRVDRSTTPAAVTTAGSGLNLM